MTGGVAPVIVRSSASGRVGAAVLQCKSRSFFPARAALRSNHRQLSPPHSGSSAKGAAHWVRARSLRKTRRVVRVRGSARKSDGKASRNSKTHRKIAVSPRGFRPGGCGSRAAQKGMWMLGPRRRANHSSGKSRGGATSACAPECHVNFPPRRTARRGSTDSVA